MKLFWAWALCAVACLGVSPAHATRGSATNVEKIPLAPSYFEANRGQVASRYTYLARLGNYTVLTSPNAVTLLLPQRSATDAKLSRSTPVTLRFVGATVNAKASIRGEQALPGRVNYYLGTKAHWTANVATYSSVRYTQLYPGIDLVLRLTQGQLEYDLEVEPGADPSAIRIETEGATQARLDEKGNLNLTTAAGRLTQRQPIIFQLENGRRTPVSGRLNVAKTSELAFVVGDYKRDQRLIIDPVIIFSTYLGGNRVDPTNDRDRVDTIQSIARDSEGNVIVVGQTTSVGFPIQSATVPDPLKPGRFDTIAAEQTTHGGTFCLPPGPNETPRRPDFDAFIAKFSPTGALLFSTYFGGCGSDAARAVVLDDKNEIYLAGSTTSPDFPTSSRAAQSQIAGKLDGFVVKLTRDGALQYSTYVGGSDDDGMRAIQVDKSGGAWVTGYTKSSNFPIGRAPDETASPPAVQADFRGGLKSDAFLVRVATTGQDFTYTTFLGGSGDEVGESLALRPTPDNSNGLQILVAGETESGDFPLGDTSVPYKRYNSGTGECRDTDGDLVGPSHFCRDAFAIMLEFNLPPGGTQTAKLKFGTFMGGAKDDEAVGIAFADLTTPNPIEFWMAGNTRSQGAKIAKNEGTPIPNTEEQKPFLDYFQIYQPLSEDVVAPEGGLEPYLVKFNATRDDEEKNATFGKYKFKLLHSTFVGGTDSDAVAEMKVVVAGDKTYPFGDLNKVSAVYLAGRTASSDFPTKNAFQTVAVNDEGFLAKIVESADKSKLELVYSTLIGGEQADYIFGLASDGATTIVAGGTVSNQLPVTAGAYQNRHGAVEDAFIVSLKDDDTTVTTDISLTIDSSVNSLYLGKDFKLTLTAMNNGSPIPAIAPRLALQIPAGVEILSNSMAGFCTVVRRGLTSEELERTTARRELYCDIGDASTPSALRNGTNVTLVLQVRPKFSGQLSFQASVLSQTADNIASNNKATRRVNVVEAPSQGDLGIMELGVLLGWGALFRLVGRRR